MIAATIKLDYRSTTYTIYYRSAEYAREHGELDLYRETIRSCKDCKADIEKICSARFDGMHLDRVSVYELLSIWPPEIVAIVLSATVLSKSHDGRFSPAVKRWAEEIGQLATDSTWFTVNTHPAILNGFIAMFISIAY